MVARVDVFREVKIECPPTRVVPQEVVFCVKGVFSLTNVILGSGGSAHQFGGAENGPGWQALLLVPAVLHRDKKWDKGCSRGLKMGQRLGFVPCLLSFPRQTQARDGG